VLESRRGSLGDRHFFVNAKSLAHRVADFAQRGVGFYGLEEIWHQVLGSSGRFAQRVQATFYLGVRAICAQVAQTVALAMRHGFVYLQNLERLFLGNVIIHANYDFFFAVNRLLVPVRGLGNFTLRIRALDRSDHPIFIFSWNLFHVIDKDSPLHGLTASDLTASDTILVLNVGGVDDNSAQQLYARHIYYPGDIRWQHRYKDITSVSPQGRLLLDYTKFHDTVPE